MSRRLLGAVILVLLLCWGAAAPASAVETGETETEPAGEEAPANIDEVGTRSTTAEQFLPEPYEDPAWFRFLRWPLLAIGLVAVTAVLLLYLRWQPHFAEEKRSPKRRR